MPFDSSTAKSLPPQEDVGSLGPPCITPRSTQTSQEPQKTSSSHTADSHVRPAKPTTLAPGTIWTCGNCFGQDRFRFVDPAENPGPPDPWEATVTDCYLYEDTEVWCTNCGKKDTVRWDIPQRLTKSERTVLAWNSALAEVKSKTDQSSSIR
jgi:hypothetical protein